MRGIFLVLSMMTVVACTAGRITVDVVCMCNASEGGACYGA